MLAFASTKADTNEPYTLAIGAAVSAVILSLTSGDDRSICAPTKRKHTFDAVAEGTYEV
jgi:hypothetical protein